MRYLRWVGLMSSLLFVGVLVAPIQSEAQPTLKLTVGERTIDVQLGGAIAGPDCVPAEDAFTNCYLIPLGSVCFTSECGSGSSTAWIIGDYSTTTPSTSDDNVHARLIVTDNSGTGLDKFRISGVTFTPGPNNTAANTKLTVEYSNLFNQRSNTGKYIMGLLIGGNYNAGNSNNRGNSINYSGVGTFCNSDTQTATCLSQPVAIGSTLSSRVSTAGIATLAKTYGIGANGTASLQSPTTVALPSFDCDTGGGVCNPPITMTFDVSVSERDQMALAGTGYTFGCLKSNGESDIETFTTTTTTLTCRQQIRQAMRQAARKEARALRQVSGHHFTCPVCKEGHEDEECDDNDL